MIGERIREIRTVLGLTQTEFANKVGITPSGLSQIESGKRKPSYDTIQKIIETFNLNPRALFPEKK